MNSSDFRDLSLAAGAMRLHAVEAGKSHDQTIIFLHGWPEDWSEWREIMQQASQNFRVIAFDLPGVGGSHGAPAGGEKAAIASVVHEAVASLDLGHYTLVGHDAGAMVAYAYGRAYDEELNGLVLLSSVVPGLEPWSSVLANPYVWHFAFHATPGLPEMLIMGKQRQYFDHFFDILANQKEKISFAARDSYAVAHGSVESLTAGLDWYRGFPKDAEHNKAITSDFTTPLLYLRGEFEGGDMDEYVRGFKAAGIQSIQTARIPGSGHFTPEENPEAVWSKIETFIKNI